MLDTPFYIACLKLSGRRCLVVGGGEVGLEKVEGLLACEGEVTLIAPRAVPALAELAAEGSIRWERREYAGAADLEGVFMVIASTDDTDVNIQIYDDAERRAMLVNVVDVPPLCNFILPAIIRTGPLAIAISTAGASPALAKRIRNEIAGLVFAALPDDRPLGGQVAERLDGVRRHERYVAAAGEQALDLLESDVAAADHQAAASFEPQARDVEGRVEHALNAALIADPPAELADALLAGVGLCGHISIVRAAGVRYSNRMITASGEPHSNAESHEPSSTRDRLVAEGMRLFAEKGYRATTVSEIAAAAGLSPRAGGLYRHFPSKRELFAAGIERHGAELDRLSSAASLLPLENLRSDLRLMARWTLKELARERQMMMILQRDGRDFPEIQSAARERVVDRGYAEARRWINRRIESPGAVDTRALSAVLFTSLVSYRTSEVMLGEPPGGVDENEFVDAWVDAAARVLSSLGATSKSTNGGTR